MANLRIFYYHIDNIVIDNDIRLRWRINMEKYRTSVFQLAVMHI